MPVLRVRRRLCNHNLITLVLSFIKARARIVAQVRPRVGQNGRFWGSVGKTVATASTRLMEQKGVWAHNILNCMLALSSIGLGC